MTPAAGKPSWPGCSRPLTFALLIIRQAVTLPKPQLEPAVLNVSQSYVYAQQQGLFNRIGNFFSGNPNSQQQVYQIAQQKIQTAARQSPLLTEAQKNTEGMLTGMLTSLGFQHVTVTFGGPPAG